MKASVLISLTLGIGAFLMLEASPEFTANAPKTTPTLSPPVTLAATKFDPVTKTDQLSKNLHVLYARRSKVLEGSKSRDIEAVVDELEKIEDEIFEETERLIAVLKEVKK